MRIRSLLLPTLVLAVAACGGETGTTTTLAPTSSTVPATTTTTAATTTTTAETTTTVDGTTTTTQTIDVRYEGGQVVGQDRFTFALGEQVSVSVLSDTADEVHVHGYDLHFAAEPGVPIEITFAADVPGIFEVEVESSHTLLFELEITP